MNFCGFISSIFLKFCKICSNFDGSYSSVESSSYFLKSGELIWSVRLKQYWRVLCLFANCHGKKNNNTSSALSVLLYNILVFYFISCLAFLSSVSFLFPLSFSVFLQAVNPSYLFLLSSKISCLQYLFNPAPVHQSSSVSQFIVLSCTYFISDDMISTIFLVLPCVLLPHQPLCFAVQVLCYLSCSHDESTLWVPFFHQPYNCTIQ